MIKRLISKMPITLILAGILFTTPLFANTEEQAVATIEKLHQTLLEVMQESSSLGFDGAGSKVESSVG